MTRGLPIHYPQLDTKGGEIKVISVCLLHFPGISRQYMSGFTTHCRGHGRGGQALLNPGGSRVKAMYGPGYRPVPAGTSSGLNSQSRGVAWVAIRSGHIRCRKA